MTGSSKLNFKSGTSNHSKSPSINSISPKKRKQNKENLENDEPLIVSARNFIKIESFCDEENEEDGRSSPSHVMQSSPSYNTSPCKSYSTIGGP